MDCLRPSLSGCHPEIRPLHRSSSSSILTHGSLSPFHTSSGLQLSNKHQSGRSLFLQTTPFLQRPTSSFAKASSCFSPWTLIKAKQESQGETHFLKRHAGKLAVVIVGSLVFFARFAGRPVVLSRKAADTTTLPALEEWREAQRDGDENGRLYLKMLQKNPRDVEALKMVLYEKMRAGRTKEAVEYVEKLIQVEPDEVEWRLLQALSYELMGHLSKAKRLFKDILEERPLFVKALHGLAMVMHKNHEGPAVFDMLNNALELARSEQRVTEERNIRILIAQMHVVKGDLEDALKDFQDLVNEDPRDFRPYLCQGIIYSLQDKKKEAEEQFENYRSFVPQEFPNRGFLDDVILTAKTESLRQLQKEFSDEFSDKK